MRLLGELVAHPGRILVGELRNDDNPVIGDDNRGGLKGGLRPLWRIW